jgi:hypothetical protein
VSNELAGDIHADPVGGAINRDLPTAVDDHCRNDANAVDAGEDSHRFVDAPLGAVETLKKDHNVVDAAFESAEREPQTAVDPILQSF